ncbi:MAG: hypothetical protein H6861_02700 [Rhodospirillales bacterium]|nr:hypothetical protein [Rhodospirillales bacterium]
MSKSFKQILLDTWRSASYEDQKNWKITVQPIPDDNFATAEDYIDIAEQANEQAQKNLESFCKQHKFSFMSVDQESFHAFERGYYTTTDSGKKCIDFRDFLEDYAKKTGQSLNVDLMLVKPSVKELERAESKVLEKGSARDIIDYSRAMLVVLKNKPRAKKDTKSIQTLSRLIQCMENDDETRAYKNYFWLPHKDSGFRAYKALRLTTVPEDKERAGDHILTEVKIEHESQMAIDCATRPFMDIGRNTSKVKSHYTAVAQNVSTPREEAKQAAKHGMLHSRNADVVAKWQRWLYNRINKDAGLDDFLKPEPTEEEYERLYTPAWDQIFDDIVKSKSVNKKGLVRSVVQALVRTGLIPEKQAERLPAGLTQDLC